MAKQQWKASTLLNPVPVIMVTCSDKSGKPNIITLAWAGTINSEPPMVSISVRKERYSYSLIKEKGQFVINLVTKKLTYATDFCGVKSGRNIDKFEAMKLTPEKASKLDVPLIKESPVNLECAVTKVIELGSHVMFLAKVVAVNVEEKLLNEKGKLCMDRADLICYSHGEYFGLDKTLGTFGFSVSKKRNSKRNTLANTRINARTEPKTYTKTNTRTDTKTNVRTNTWTSTKPGRKPSTKPSVKPKPNTKKYIPKNK